MCEIFIMSCNLYTAEDISIHILSGSWMEEKIKTYIHKIYFVFDILLSISFQCKAMNLIKIFKT